MKKYKMLEPMPLNNELLWFTKYIGYIMSYSCVFKNNIIRFEDGNTIEVSDEYFKKYFKEVI